MSLHEPAVGSCLTRAGDCINPFASQSDLQGRITSFAAKMSKSNGYLEISRRCRRSAVAKARGILSVTAWKEACNRALMFAATMIPTLSVLIHELAACSRSIRLVNHHPSPSPCDFAGLLEIRVSARGQKSGAAWLQGHYVSILCQYPLPAVHFPGCASESLGCRCSRVFANIGLTPQETENDRNFVLAG
jgi:hypothetical protein